MTLVFNVKKMILEPRKAAGVPLDDLVLTHLLEACRLGSPAQNKIIRANGRLEAIVELSFTRCEKKTQSLFFFG